MTLCNGLAICYLESLGALMCLFSATCSLVSGTKQQEVKAEKPLHGQALHFINVISPMCS